MSSGKRVAIIGAGVSGLAAIKSCVEEGLTPVCFERTDNIAGLWRYTDEVTGQGCVMKSTITNVSKEMMCFSDFPMPDHYPNYLHNAALLEYVEEYARHFHLKRFIRFNTEVKRVTPAPDFSARGKWTVQVQDHQQNEPNVTEEVFEAVMVCTGHHSKQHRPSFPGLENFRGRVMHSSDYREPSGFQNKTVVVIGVGHSGADIAVELGPIARVFLSSRRGSWVVHRMDADHGTPFDTVYCRRWTTMLSEILPASFFQRMMARQLGGFFEHHLQCLKPESSVWAQPPTISDDLGGSVTRGEVVVKPNVKTFIGDKGVEFDDGTIEDNVDVVILATGFTFDFPFLDKGLVDVQGNTNRLPFFKYMFHPELGHNTLALVGFTEPLGGAFPVTELQSRLASRVFKGGVSLPSSAKMREDVRAQERDTIQRYVKSQRHAIQVEFVPFMDQLALLHGCKPRLVSLLLKDPVLFLHVLFGPCTSSQYRLHGPGQWPGARETILTTMNRVRNSLPAQQKKTTSSSGTSGYRSFLSCALVCFVGVSLWGVMFLRSQD